MILSNEGIRAALQTGQISISPEPQPDQYTTSAVDLILGDADLFRVWDAPKFSAPGVKVELNLAEQEFGKTAFGYLTTPRLESDGTFILPPYGKCPLHFLAMTRERVCLKRESLIAARVEGRSSFARIGLIVHLTAPTIHAGFQGPITLEIINFGPFHVKFVPFKTRLCQLIFERLETQPQGEPVTAFQEQTTPAGESRLSRLS